VQLSLWIAITRGALEIGLEKAAREQAANTLDKAWQSHHKENKIKEKSKYR
jgi:hypothetical protein